jgi:hypothetical protein
VLNIIDAGHRPSAESALAKNSADRLPESKKSALHAGKSASLTEKLANCDAFDASNADSTFSIRHFGAETVTYPR